MSIGTRVRDALITKPYRFQIQGIRFIEKCHGRALLGDDMGLGKTLQALAWAAIHPEIRPIVVLCPASLKWNWQRELQIHAGMQSQILNAHKAYGLKFRTLPTEKEKREGIRSQRKEKWFSTSLKRDRFIHKNRRTINVRSKPLRKFPKITEDILILNYEILGDWCLPLIKKVKPKLLIVDECHYVKNRGSDRTKLCRVLASACPYLIPLSGTPIVNRPIEFFPILNMLDPITYNSYWNFAMEYCGAKKGHAGWDYSGSTNTQELHNRVSKIMIRRMKSEVLKDLPAKQQSIIPVEIENRKEYEKAKHDFLNWLEEMEGKEKAMRAARALALVKIGKLKRLAAEGKMKFAIQWIKDWLEETDQKLVVFGVHRSVLGQLKEVFPSAATIDGSVPTIKRQHEVDRFQTDPKCRLFFGNLRAAGLGLTLTASSSVLFLELGWTPGEHDQAEDRVLRIGQKAASVNIYYLLGLDTIDERVWELLAAKRDIVSQVLDGKEIPPMSLKDLLSLVTKESA